MKNKRLFLLSAFLVIIGTLKAQNPIITDQFTADPTAKVFEGKMYVYPSHDIPSPIERLKEWFCMADYHVFSSDNLVDWTDHGVILSQENVPWVAPDSYSMWAPECVYKNGKYYFYFPSTPKGEGKRGFSIGVAIADKPYGPFTPQATPIEGVNGIDPCVLIDKDGQGSPLPVVGVPVKSRALNGLDSLLSIVQMPAGVPVATVAINGAKNAALIAVSILALSDGEVAARLDAFRTRQTTDVLKAEL